MAVFSSKPAAWDAEALPRPWGADRESIFEYISERLRGEDALEGGIADLPDEEVMAERDNSGLRWVAGAQDGVAVRHMSPGQAENSAALAFDLLARLVANPAPEDMERFYELFNDAEVLRFIDPFLQKIGAVENLDFERVYEFGVWLAKNAPDRGPVKAGMAIAGIFPRGMAHDMFRVLGRHEEFTLYAAVGMMNTSENPERDLWDLARHVRGWGRIHLIRHLAATEDEDIRRWMLEEGYRNEVMNEYTAYICAQTGGLRAALTDDDVNDAVLAGAGEILRALINGGVAEDIENYEDAPQVMKRYLKLAAGRALPLSQYMCISAMDSFLNETPVNKRERHYAGWPQVLREALAQETDALLTDPRWRKMAQEGLESDDVAVFRVASEAAAEMGLDPWPHHFTRQEKDVSDEWYFLMRTDDSERLDRALELAAKQLPLEDIASGPEDTAGLGMAYRAHCSLDFILQGLDGEGRSDKGWDFIRAGLKSPVVRNRVSALKLVERRGGETWPDDMGALLRQALEDEPVDEVAEALSAVLAAEAPSAA